MLPGKEIDPADNFEDCARAWAETYDQPFPYSGQAFLRALEFLQANFRGVYPETVEYILIDPFAFAARVAQYRYGMHGGFDHD